MDVLEAGKLREGLQKDINNLIDGFEASTSLTVESIYLDHMTDCNTNREITIGVRVDVHL